MDEALRLCWQRYRTWAATARSLKRSDDWWKRVVLTLTVVGTVTGTLGPFARLTSWSASAAGYIGAAALALATYFGKQLLDAAHQQNWTRARAAAEAFKSESYRYAVQAPPFDADDRMSRLATRIGELDKLTQGRVQALNVDADASKDMPSAPLSIEDYVLKRVNDQTSWYRRRAAESQSAIARGRALALAFGGFAALLSIFTATRTDGTLAAASLGYRHHAGRSHRRVPFKQVTTKRSRSSTGRRPRRLIGKCWSFEQRRRCRVNSGSLSTRRP